MYYYSDTYTSYWHNYKPTWTIQFFIPFEIRLLFVVKQLRQPLISRRERKLSIFCGTVKTASDTARERLMKIDCSVEIFCLCRDSNRGHPATSTDAPDRSTAAVPHCGLIIWLLLFMSRGCIGSVEFQLTNNPIMEILLEGKDQITGKRVWRQLRDLK